MGVGGWFLCLHYFGSYEGVKERGRILGDCDMREFIRLRDSLLREEDGMFAVGLCVGCECVRAAKVVCHPYQESQKR